MKPRGVLAWHFVQEDGRLRYNDGRKVVAGKTYTASEGSLKLCLYGMHASVKPCDALKYAPGPIVCRVRLSGEILHGPDKLVARTRKVIWAADATEKLCEYARWCALQVVHLWEAPDVVKQYLETGDESVRDAAWDAAWAASWDATRAATRAARAAAWDAARAATRAATWDAARAAARAAAWAATRAASRDAARAATWDAQSKQLHKLLMELR
jgi:hypothetical protein